MANSVEMVVLTKSAKNGGHCVAGIDVDTGNWVRLVSNDLNTHGALSNQDMQYQDRSYCTPLDIVSVPIIKACPSQYQPENILIDQESLWKRLGRMSIQDLLELHPPEIHDSLLGNVYPYITSERIGAVGHSLILVEAEGLLLTHPREHSTKASFRYQFTQYENISVTDRDFYLVSNNTLFTRSILVMSLPDVPYGERRYYKFIAKIFPLSFE